MNEFLQTYPILPEVILAVGAMIILLMGGMGATTASRMSRWALRSFC